MRLKHLTTYAAVAGAIAAPVAFASAANATTGGGISSAYGVAATGLVNLPATPAVVSDGALKDKSLVELPANPLVKLKVLHTSAAASKARASVVDLRVAKALLSAHLVTAKCDNGVGSSHLVKASIAGHKLAVDASPNTALTVPVSGVGGVSVVLNKQVHNPNGSLTVTAIEVNVALLGKAQSIDISSATCAAGGNATPPKVPGSPKPTDPGNGTPPGEAPTPTPVNSDLPVTG